MVKEALEKKLSDFKNQNNLTLKEEEKEEPLSEQQKEKALDGLSELIINASVLSAIALKKSSLPGKEIT
jgi:hypothetical protein